MIHADNLSPCQCQKLSADKKIRIGNLCILFLKIFIRCFFSSIYLRAEVLFLKSYNNPPLRVNSLCFPTRCLNINYILKQYRRGPNCMELGDLQQK